MKSRDIKVTKGDTRLDHYLNQQNVGLSRTQLQKLILGGWILVNDQSAKSNGIVRKGDKITITVPPPTPSHLIPEDIPIEIVYEDSDLIIVNKSAGMAIHPSPGHPSHTLVNALISIYPSLPGINGENRPGIVHRLDKNTSGLLIVAKTSQAHINISNQLKHRNVKKGYLALTAGNIKPNSGTINLPIGRDRRNRKRMAIVSGGRESITKYKVLEHLMGFSYLEVYTKTGRTHQIRVHLAALGHPLAGDELYGKKLSFLNHHFLHSYLIGFDHPSTGKYMEYTSSLPNNLEEVIRTIKLGEI